MKAETWVGRKVICISNGFDAPDKDEESPEDLAIREAKKQEEFDKEMEETEEYYKEEERLRKEKAEAKRKKDQEAMDKELLRLYPNYRDIQGVLFTNMAGEPVEVSMDEFIARGGFQ